MMAVLQIQCRSHFHNNDKLIASLFRFNLPEDGLPSVDYWLTSFQSMLLDGVELGREPLDVSVWAPGLINIIAVIGNCLLSRINFNDVPSKPFVCHQATASAGRQLRSQQLPCSIRLECHCEVKCFQSCGAKQHAEHVGHFFCHLIFSVRFFSI